MKPNEASGDEILSAIPHRAPMLLVDEVVERFENDIHCRKTFRPDEPFTQGHYPGNPIVPGVMLCEAAMQAGAVLLSAKVPPQSGQVPVATRMNDIKFKRVVRPGEPIDIHVTLNESMANAFFLTAKLRVDGQLAARLDFACALAAIPE